MKQPDRNEYDYNKIIGLFVLLYGGAMMVFIVIPLIAYIRDIWV